MSAPEIAPAAPPGPTRPDAIRRAAILRSVRVHHGAQWRDVARRQADVARRAADDFEAAGDPGGRCADTPSVAHAPRCRLGDE